MHPKMPKRTMVRALLVPARAVAATGEWKMRSRSGYLLALDISRQSGMHFDEKAYRDDPFWQRRRPGRSLH